MKNQLRINHIALVLPDVEKTAQLLSKYNFNIGAIDQFEPLGTKEIYIEQSKSGALLLMQPTKAGSYQRSLDKQGASVHHVAIDVLDLESFIEEIAHSGWLLHPHSVASMKKLRVVWLKRPEFPVLIEVTEVQKLSDEPEFVGNILLNTDIVNQKLIDTLGLNTFITITDQENQLLLDGQYFKISELISTAKT